MSTAQRHSPIAKPGASSGEGRKQDFIPMSVPMFDAFLFVPLPLLRPDIDKGPFRFRRTGGRVYNFRHRQWEKNTSTGASCAMIPHAPLTISERKLSDPRFVVPGIV